MVDVVDPATRSRMMSRIRGKNTVPEMRVRKFLHARGFRYRLHVKNLPGSPDIVLPKYRIVIFVHGCFWHQHLACHHASMPKSNVAFWKEKLEGNVSRDLRNIVALKKNGWRCLVIWECQTEDDRQMEKLVKRIIPPKTLKG